MIRDSYNVRSVYGREGVRILFLLFYPLISSSLLYYTTQDTNPFVSYETSYLTPEEWIRLTGANYFRRTFFTVNSIRPWTYCSSLIDFLTATLLPQLSCYKIRRACRTVVEPLLSLVLRQFLKNCSCYTNFLCPVRPTCTPRSFCIVSFEWKGMSRI